QGRRRRREDAVPGRGRRLPPAVAADPDDGVFVHSRRDSAADGDRCRLRDAPRPGNGGVFGNDGGDNLRTVPDSGVLRGSAKVRPEKTGGGDGGGRVNGETDSRVVGISW